MANAAPMAQVHVFIASSLDGFIAGPNDELDWLDGHEGEIDTYHPFMETVGALLMGRRTFDVVSGFDVPWPYGETPVLVPTSRPLVTEVDSVRAISGSIEELIAQAQEVAGEKNVYLDGGRMIRSALDAGLVDELTLTMIPVALGAGIPLFAGVRQPHAMELLSTRPLGGGLVELRYRPQRA